MKNSTQLKVEYLKVKEDTIKELKRVIKARTIRNGLGIALEKDQHFEDEANNTIIGCDAEEVFFEDIGGEQGEYPLDELGITDALHLLTILE